MSLFIVNKKQKHLRQYLSRTRENEEEQVEDFFTKNHKSKSSSKVQNIPGKNIGSRFNTTAAQHCQINFKIKTFYQPSNEYKFTGSCYKKKYRGSLKMIKAAQYEKNANQSNLLNTQYPNHHEDQQIQTDNCEGSIQNVLSKSEVFISLSPNKTVPYKRSSFKLSLNREQTKFKIKNPAPVQQAKFLVNIKKQFLKRHGLKPKRKSSQENDLIKIQDYLSEQTDSFKRRMETQLVRVGQGRLISQFKERKGKVYLSGLHSISRKKKQVEDIDRLLFQSRQSYSTPNTLISHLKLCSQKKKKLENLKQINAKKMQNCLQKLKNLNLKRQFAANNFIM